MHNCKKIPSSDREDLVPVWLWTKREGVFGLETALAIHGLSDVLPAHHDVFVPSTWAKRRVKAPRIIRLHVEDVPTADWQWIGPVPVTKPARTLRDCMQHHVQRDLVAQAIAEAIEPRLITRTEGRRIEREAKRSRREMRCPGATSRACTRQRVRFSIRS